MSDNSIDWDEEFADERQRILRVMEKMLDMGIAGV